MPVYNFKTIGTVPSTKGFVDIILSKTQRKTPTVVRRGWNIIRIRSFYMRKVKYTQQNFHDKLSKILEDFPRLEDIHPFYADLINVLYSKDHYKLALGQLNTARQLIDNLAKDYLKLLKFGDSLYRCKELKRAALGRMCTLMKKLNSSLLYLEQVRQHLSRLPSIDPNTRTLMITGYPNVGKSSFINKVSRADVDVQPYAFTTKSLFVGHTDYKYVRWQVIDTPGILDHPLEDRNTIEMQAITALAHLNSTVLYFVDISESCGYTIKQQAALYHSIKPLFANKPLLVVANKIDLRPLSDLDEEDMALINGIAADKNTQILTMSNATEEGVDMVKQTACDMLLMQRVERKMKSKRVKDVINRIQIQQPVKRDHKARATSIPQSVRNERKTVAAGGVKAKRKTEKEIELEAGGPGVYNINLQKVWKLRNDAWKNDVVPEILDGKNIADFVDADIEARLAELELEEEELERQFELDMEDRDSGLSDDEQDLVDKIRKKKKLVVAAGRLRSTNNNSKVPRKYKVRTAEKMGEHLGALGLDTTKLRSRSKTRRKRGRDDDDDDDDVEMGGVSDGKKKKKGKDNIGGEEFAFGGGRRTRSKSRAASGVRDEASRSRSRARTEGSMTKKQKKQAVTLAKNSQKDWVSRARKGPADRRFLDLKPKHLNTGKRGIGKTDWR